MCYKPKVSLEFLSFKVKRSSHGLYHILKNSQNLFLFFLYFLLNHFCVYGVWVFKGSDEYTIF